MVVLKTYRSLLVDLFSGNMDIQAGALFLVMALPWMVFQFIMLEKCRRLLLWLLPLLLIVLCVFIGEIMTVKATGWDGLGWAILINYFSYGLLGELGGVLFWVIRRKMKKHTAG